MMIPDLNSKILAYCKSRLGKKVKRGECWDLAYYALKDNKGEFPKGSGDSLYRWSSKVIPFKQAISGDILQFYKYKIEYNESKKDGGGREGWLSLGFPRHTSIFIEALNNGQVKVYEQNIGTPPKKEVAINSYYLFPGEFESQGGNTKVIRTEGNVVVYRPRLLPKSETALYIQRRQSLGMQKGLRPSASRKVSPFSSIV